MSLEQVTQSLYKLKEKPLAIQVLNAFAKQAYLWPEYDDLAKCFFKLKEYKDAIKYSELALTTAYTMERSWAARANLINVLNHANYPEEALFHIANQERLIPEDQDTRLEKAFSYFLMNDRDKAESILLSELERDDLTTEVQTKILFNLGTYCLWRDEFQKGLSLFLHKGQELDYWRKAKLPFKFWDGGIKPGSSIVLYAEAGIGDEIINVRFMQTLSDLGMEPIWFTDRKDMVEIFNANGFKATSDIKVIQSMASKDPSLLWTYPMSLPVYLDLQYKNLWYAPYLKPLEKYWGTAVCLVDEHVKEDAPNKKYKIGLRWAGNPEYDHDLHRSVELNDILDTLIDTDAELYSLQKDSAVDDLINSRLKVEELGTKLDSFGLTLSVINELDLVITTCTSVAHAAAAMGKRVCIFVPISAYYTWSHSMAQSPWYGDNVTILRQTKPRDWTEAMLQLRKILAAEFA